MLPQHCGEPDQEEEPAGQLHEFKDQKNKEETANKYKVVSTEGRKTGPEFIFKRYTNTSDPCTKQNI